MPKETSSTYRTGKTVLVVEDDPVFLSFACESLKNEGIEALSATTTQEAFLKLQEKSVDLILLDIRLKAEDGIVVIPKFKSMYPKVPIVILTGLGYDHELMKSATDKGAIAYFSKENNFEDLIQILERIFGRVAK